MRSLLCVVSVLLIALPSSGQDSLNITNISEFRFWDRAVSVDIAGSFAFLATGESGLQVVDVSNVDDPRIVASVDIPGSAESVVVSGNYAYVLSNGLYILDISDPAAPYVTGLYPLPDEVWARSMAVSGDLVALVVSLRYVPADDTLIFLSVSDHAAPQVLSELVVTYWMDNLAILDTLLLCQGSDYDSDLRVFDISDPLFPEEIGSTDGLISFGGIGDIVAEGDHAYVLADEGSDSLYSIDLSNPAEPVPVAQVPISTYFDSDLELDPVLLRLYVCHYGTVSIFDISDPAQLNLLGEYGLPRGWALASHHVGDTLYVSTSQNQLLILDVSQPAAPQVLGSYDHSPASVTHGIRLYGDYLCLPYGRNAYCSGCGDLLIVNALNPARLEPASFGFGGEEASTLAVRDHYAYLCATYVDLVDPLKIYDLTNPGAPQLLSSLDLPGIANAISLAGDAAFINTFNYGYDISRVDVQDPTNPVLVASYNIFHGTPYDLAVADSLLLVAANVGLRIYRTDNPDSLVQVGSIFPDTELRSVAVSEHFAYTSSASDTLYVVDFSTPSAPIEIAAIPIQAAEQILIAGDSAYLACASAGLRVLDISEPSNPHEVAFYDTPGWTNGIALRDSLIFVSDDDRIGVYRLLPPVKANPPTAPVPACLSFTVYPNPFNQSVKLVLAGFTGQDFEIGLYNLLGQMVDVVHRGPLTGGQLHYQAPPWLASGVYLLSAHDKHSVQTKKIILMK